MKSIIPLQRKGGRSTTSHTVKTRDVPSAHSLFSKARENLLNANQWHQLAGLSSAKFHVINSEGAETETVAKEGNYLRITIPGAPGSEAGDGFDWVKVEKIEEEESEDREYIAMRVRPAVPPFFNKKEIAHFFTPEATSTFCIERKGRNVAAAVFGRNEKPNIEVHSFLNKIRNLFVAAAALIGLNKPQWKSLVKGLLDKS